MNKFLLGLVFILIALFPRAEDGYRLWLRYDKIADATLHHTYSNQLQAISVQGTTPAFSVAQAELQTGLQGLLAKTIPVNQQLRGPGIILAAKGNAPSGFGSIDYAALGKEGFAIYSSKTAGKNQILITANTNIGILYGVFHFLRLLQTHQSIQQLTITSIPNIQHRILNHWDNLNRHVERGYAGISIWNWHQLPGYLDQRYTDYARANASLGINGTVLTNVNANALVLTPGYLQKVKALADVFRPYGIRVYLTARFSAPIESGGLKTADPLNDSVKTWWKEK